MVAKVYLRIVAATLLACLCAPLSRNQEYDRRDGNWWRQIDTVARANYLSGLLDGMQIGNRMALSNGKPTDKAALTQADASFSEYRAKYLAGVTGIQLTDALDNLYSDARNRQILVYNGVWYVLNQIAGKPATEMQPLIEALRKDAANDATGKP